MSKESQNEQSYKRIKGRIESLSDLVFGLALSIGSIALIGNIPRDPGSLESDILFFAFSFLIVIMMWGGYTRTVAYLSIETESIFYLNVALLFVVALEPFLFYVLVSQPSSPSALPFVDTASAFYAIDVGSMYMILAGFTYIVAMQEAKKDKQNILVGRFKRLTFWFTVAAAMFLFSALPIFSALTSLGFLRFYFWYASLALSFMSRLIGRSPKDKPSLKESQ